MKWTDFIFDTDDVQLNDYDLYKGWEYQTRFIKQQDYDKRKIDYCHNNHIPLVIIPYYDKNKITLDYIKEKYHEAKEILEYREV